MIPFPTAEAQVTDSLHDRLHTLFDQIKDFPEACRCEHGTHLKPRAFVAFLELRQLIEREVLPALFQIEKRSQTGSIANEEELPQISSIADDSGEPHASPKGSAT